MVDATFACQIGDGPLIATAIHDGHALWPEVAELVLASDGQRLHEEDPFTRLLTEVAATRIVATHSRFQCDFNRPREAAIYRTPEEAWGLPVWKSPPPSELVEKLLAEHDAFYAMLQATCDAKLREHGRFVVFDIHSYNAADDVENPEINLGTGSMPPRWRRVADDFMQAVEPLDVRENVRFRGGQLSRWVHEQYPLDGCALAIEVRKPFDVAHVVGALSRGAHAVLEVL
jgi:N-formylglutamate amidohydrolase